MSKLEELVLLFTHNRQQGHTTAMLDGAMASNAVIIVADSRQRRLFVTTNLKAITLDELDNLRGYRGPILVDHYAWQIAFWEHQQEMKKKLLATSTTVKHGSVGNLLAKRKRPSKNK